MTMPAMELGTTIGLAGAASSAAFILEEAARRLPAHIGWQEPGKEKTHHRAWWWICGSTIGALMMAWFWRADTTAAATMAAVSLVLGYICATDVRDRWVPDHATFPLIIAGLLASPITTQPERVQGMAICWAAAVVWQVAMAPLSGKRLDAETFSTGDQALAAAIGAWMGATVGGIALGLGATLMLASMATMPQPDERTHALARAAGYDEETRTFPAITYLALAAWVVMLLTARNYH
jgi:prepilin signal peptidase PulO-like enzyme (type II secretory pathway)